MQLFPVCSCGRYNVCCYAICFPDNLSASRRRGFYGYFFNNIVLINCVYLHGKSSSLNRSVVLCMDQDASARIFAGIVPSDVYNGSRFPCEFCGSRNVAQKVTIIVLFARMCKKDDRAIAACGNVHQVHRRSPFELRTQALADVLQG